MRPRYAGRWRSNARIRKVTDDCCDTAAKDNAFERTLCSKRKADGWSVLRMNRAVDDGCDREVSSSRPDADGTLGQIPAFTEWKLLAVADRSARVVQLVSGFGESGSIGEPKAGARRLVT